MMQLSHLLPWACGEHTGWGTHTAHGVGDTGWGTHTSWSPCPWAARDQRLHRRSGQLDTHLRAGAKAQAGSLRRKGRNGCKVAVKPGALCTSRHPMSFATGNKTMSIPTWWLKKKKKPIWVKIYCTWQGRLSTNCMGVPGTSVQPLVPSNSPSLPSLELSGPSSEPKQCCGKGTGT